MNIEAKELSKIYGSGESRVVALDKVNLEIASSDFISIMGPSGSGKSTLLHLLSGLDKPTSGSLTYDGKDIYRFNVLISPSAHRIYLSAIQSSPCADRKRKHHHAPASGQKAAGRSISKSAYGFVRYS